MPPAFSSKNRRRLVAPIALATAAVTGIGVLSTGALFTDTATVDSNVFTAGTVDLGTTPAQTALSASNMAPGEVITAPITVRNDGSLDFRYAMESVATGGLAPALTLQVKTGVATCTTAGYTASGTNLYGPAAPVGTASGMKVIGDKRQGADPGDRTLTAGGSEVLCVQIALPGSAATDAYQSQTANVTFNFYAEQTKNNGSFTDSSGGRPAAPAGQTAKPITSGDGSIYGIRLQWDKATSETATGYNILRSSDGGTTWQNLAQIPDVNTTSYTDATGSAGVEYAYQVQTVDTDGNTSPVAPPTPSTTATTPVAPPTGVAAIGTTDGVVVTWVPTTQPGVSGYTVQRSSDGGESWLPVATVDGGGATSYTDTTGTPGTAYTYTVTAKGTGGATSTTGTGGSSGSGSVSAPVTAPDLGQNQPLDQPTGQTVETDDTCATVHWNKATSPKAVGYKVTRTSDQGNTWTTIAVINDVNTVSYCDTTTLAGVTYHYLVQSVDKNGNTSPAPTGTDDTASGTTPVAAVTGATATSVNGGVTITWDPSTQSGVTGYTVARSTDGGKTWTSLTTLGSTVFSYTDTTGTPGTTYTYGVTVRGTNGTVSQTTSTAPVTFSAAQAPSAPATATATVATSGSTSTVNIAWDASSGPNLTGYTLYRSSDSGTTWATLGTVDDSTTTYTDTTGTTGTTYIYAVAASGPGGTASTRTITAPVTLPDAPVVTAVASSTGTTGKVVLTWPAFGAAGNAGYSVYRSADGGTTWSTVNATLGATVTTFTDNAPLQGNTYIYAVTTRTSGGVAGPRQLSASVTIPWVTPAAPASITATASSSLSTASVAISWTKSAGPNLTGNTVYRSTDNGTTWQVLTDTVAATATAYTDTTAQQGTTYLYAVAANGQAGSVSDKKVSTAVTPAWVKPATPATLTLTSSSSPSDSTASVALTWAASTSTGANLSGYSIYRSTDSGSTYTLLDTVAPGTLTYTDTTAVQGQAYSYGVTANAQDGTPSTKKVASVTPAYTTPVAPASLSIVSAVAATTGTSATVTMSWPTTGPNLKGFRIYRSTDNGTTWTTLYTNTTDPTQSTYADATAVQGMTYLYAVAAMGPNNVASDKTISDPVLPYGATPPNLPTNVTVTPTSVTTTASVKVNWTKPTGPLPSGYTVYRSSDNGTTWDTLTTSVANSVVTYTDATAQQGVTYLYAVATNGATGYTTAKVISAQVTPDVIPLAPARLNTTVTSSTTASTATVVLSWDAATGPNLSGYAVYRSTNGGTTWATLSSTIAATTLSYTDTTAAQGTAYTYAVAAKGKGTELSDKTLADAITPDWTTPAAPTGLTATATPSTSATTASVALAWTKSAGPNLTGYIVNRSDDGGATWTTLSSTVSLASVGYTDINTVQGVTYTYQVIAKGQAGATAAPVAQTITVGYGTPLAPTTATATQTSLGTNPAVSVTWSKPTGTLATGYNLYRSVDNGTTWSLITTLPLATASYLDTDVSANTAYMYAVSTTSDHGEASAKKATASITVQPYDKSDQPTGTSQTINMAAATDNLADMGTGPDGYIYATGNNAVQRLNPTTGAITTIAALPGSGNMGIGPDGTIVAVATGGIYKVNPTTGETTQVSTTAGVDVDMDSHGNIYTMINNVDYPGPKDSGTLQYADGISTTIQYLDGTTGAVLNSWTLSIPAATSLGQSSIRTGVSINVDNNDQVYLYSTLIQYTTGLPNQSASMSLLDPTTGALTAVSAAGAVAAVMPDNTLVSESTYQPVDGLAATNVVIRVGGTSRTIAQLSSSPSHPWIFAYAPDGKSLYFRSGGKSLTRFWL